MEDKKYPLEDVVTVEEGSKPPLEIINEGPTQPEERVQFSNKLEEVEEEAEEDPDEIKPEHDSGVFAPKMKNFMGVALKEAKKALERNEIPVGAVVVKDNRIIAKAFNNREESKEITSHAEINAIKKAGKKLDDWHLNNCEIYVTIEPCPMCYSAILQTNIKKLVYGAPEPRTGAVESKTDLNLIYHKPIEIFSGVLEDDCRAIIKEFFINKRKNVKNYS